MVTDASEGEVVMPQGLAYRAALIAGGESGAGSRVVVYAIATLTGVAVVQMLGDPAIMRARADELHLIALLATFGE